MKKTCSLFLAMLLIGMLACKNGKELKTESGFRYILYTDNKGPKIEVGNYVTIEMAYSNEKDSVIYDSRAGGSSIRFRLEKIPFKGSFEDGITNLTTNDSATFFVPADSLYNFLYKTQGAESVPQQKTAFIPGTFLKFNIKIVRIQTEVQAEEEMLMQLGEKEKKERTDIFNFVNTKKIMATPDTSGFYLIMRGNGNGASIDSGKIVTIEYEGRFLNDSVFDGTKKAGHPYRFISGTHHVIRGWEMAMKELHEGDKFTLILPSKLAYGEEGILDPKKGKYIVPPYSPLVFDIDIISVEDAPAVSRK